MSPPASALIELTDPNASNFLMPAFVELASGVVLRSLSSASPSLDISEKKTLLLVKPEKLVNILLRLEILIPHIPDIHSLLPGNKNIEPTIQYRTE